MSGSAVAVHHARHPPNGMGSQGMVALDTLGILFRWQLFDHWAHLGGTVFGVWCALPRLIMRYLHPPPPPLPSVWPKLGL